MPDLPASNTDVEAELQGELFLVAEAYAQKSLKNEPGWGLKAGSPRLTALAVSLRSTDYQSEPEYALQGLLKTTWQLLGGTSMASLLGVTSDAASKLTVGEAARILFSSDSGHKLPRPGSRYDAAVKRLLERLGMEHESAKRREEATTAIRRAIARKLIEMQASADLAAQVRPAAEPPDFQLPRSELRGKIIAALEGTVPVVLRGEPGNGKRSVSRRIVQEQYVGQRVVVIRGPSGPNAPMYEGDIESALSVAGVEEISSSVEAAERRLRRVLRSPGSLDLVVFEDADSRMIDFLITGSKVPVVATTDAKPSSPELKLIFVPAFTVDEGDAYLQLTLDDSTQQDRSELVQLLGARPIALRLVVNLVREHGLRLDALRAACRADVPKLLETAAGLIDGENVPGLLGIYGAVAAQIDEYEHARELAELLVWVTGSVPIADLYELTDRGAGDDADRLQLKTGLKQLARVGVIELGDVDVSINRLTVDLLRTIWQGRSGSTLLRFVALATRWAVGSDDDSLKATEASPLFGISSLAEHIGLERNEDRETFLSASANAVLAAMYVSDWLVPGREVGAVGLAADEMLVWQGSDDFLRTGQVGPNAVLVELRSGADMKLWTAGGVRLASLSEAWTVRSLHRVCGTALGQLVGGDSPAFKAQRSLPSVLGPQADARLHRYVLPEQVEQPTAKGAFLWTACGRQVAVPDASGDLLPLECGDCAAAPLELLELDGWSDCLGSLEVVMTEALPTASWCDQAVVFMTAALTQPEADRRAPSLAWCRVALALAPEDDPFARSLRTWAEGTIPGL